MLTNDSKYQTVSNVLQLLKSAFSKHCPVVYFQGEVSEAKISFAGHLYLKIKDEQGVLNAAIWSGVLARQSFRPQVGQKILCQGAPDIFSKSGQLQIIIAHILPAGEGDLQKKFLELKDKLTKEGIFDIARKRALPFFPQSIGLVTSPQGAVIHDMQVKFAERMPGVRLYLYPASVQGTGSAEDVVAGLEYFNRQAAVDLIIVARGGGSLEDLWTFNEEKVVRAVFASKIPVISGIGHEPDITLTDLVADYRAPTPTAAAEKAVPRISDLLERVIENQRRLNDLDRWFYPKMQQLDELQGNFRISYRNYFAVLKERLNSLHKSVRLLEPHQLIRNNQIRISNLSERLKLGFKNSIARQVTQIDFLETRWRNVNPKNILQRGFALIKKGTELISDPGDLKSGQNFVVEFAKGEVEAVIK